MMSMQSRAARRGKVLCGRLATTFLVASLLSACGGGGGGGNPPPPPPPVDTTAPDTAISAQPAVLAVSNSATFSFTATEAGSTFQSSLDGAAYAAATTPLTINNLAEGAHTFNVRARDAAGNTDATPASFQWTVDTVAPDTQFTVAPTGASPASTASFTATSPDAGATFEVSLDNAAFTAATFPLQLAGLGEGAHSFRVRARDAAGNVDASPATAQWIVDTVAPDTQFTAAPTGVLTVNTATITATSPDGSATFEMSLDGAAFSAATFPLQLAGLGDGMHTFRVRARDAAGNVDATPATAQWTVDTAAPTTTLVTTPGAFTNSTTATFSFTSNEVGSTFEASVDGAGYATVTSPLQLVGLAVGTHNIAVRARDPQGHVDLTPATFTWLIDLTPPTGSIVFPTPVSYTDANTLTLRGTANDANPLQSVSVNGVLAASATAFNTWRVTVPVSPGNNTLTVSITDAAGNTNFAAAAVSVANRGPMLLQTAGADYDPTGDRIVVTDVESHSLITYSVATGIGRLLANFSLVSTNSALGEVVVDAPNNRALVLDWGQDALIAVDLANGDNRSTLSQGTGTGPTRLTLGFGLAHDAANNRIFATVGGSNVILAINLATGVRSIVSSSAVGTGTAFTNPLGIAYDAMASRLLVADSPLSGAAIYSVDIATGNRVVLSQSPGTGSGPTLGGPTSIKLDAANNRLYVYCTTNSTVVSVDLATGNRTLIAGAGTGSGPTLNSYPGMAFRASTGRLFAAQRGGEILAIDTGSLVRTTIVDPRVGPGTRVEHPATVLAEQTAGAVTSLLFGEPDAQRIMRLNLTTSERTIVASGSVGAGPALGRIVDFVLDTRAPANGQSIFGLLGSPGNSLVSVDIATGNRATLTTLTGNTQPRNLRLDASLNRVLYTNADFSGTLSGLYAVQLPGLGQSAISSSGVGTGPAFTGPSSFILEPATSPTRALFVDMNPWTWRTVDLGSGARGTFTTTGGNPSLPLLGPLYFDGANSQVYGLNLYPPHLFVTTVAPGGAEIGRDMISGQVPGSMGVIGSGPLVDFGSGVYVDTARGVAFVTESTAGTIMAIDLASGDRVVIAR